MTTNRKENKRGRKRGGDRFTVNGRHGKYL